MKNTLPTLIRYGKYKMPYHDPTPHKFSSLTKRQFNIQIFGILSGVLLFTGSVYGAMYYCR
jgi:hypothetical protein